MAFSISLCAMDASCVFWESEKCSTLIARMEEKRVIEIDATSTIAIVGINGTSVSLSSDLSSKTPLEAMAKRKKKHKPLVGYRNEYELKVEATRNANIPQND